MFDEDVFSDFCPVFKFKAVLYMHRCNYTLFTSWQRRFSIMLELKLELNFKDDAAAYCMCSDNQEGGNVFHYLRITNGKEV